MLSYGSEMIKLRKLSWRKNGHHTEGRICSSVCLVGYMRGQEERCPENYILTRFWRVLNIKLEHLNLF